MLVNITDDLIIDIDDVLYLRKNGKDIFLKFKCGEAISCTSLDKEGKGLLKYIREYTNE